jgi:hypothetical protein
MVDYRLGGIPTYYMDPSRDGDMRIPDTILKCVVFIGRREGEEIKYRGTGFLVAVGHEEDGVKFSFGHLVTAKHTADAIQGAAFYVRANLRTGAVEDIRLNWDPKKPTKWYTHPTDPDADVAITRATVTEEMDALCIPSGMYR